MLIVTPVLLWQVKMSVVKKTMYDDMVYGYTFNPHYAGLNVHLQHLQTQKCN